MDEIREFAQELREAVEQEKGRKLTGREMKELEEFAESFLLLLDDEEE